MLRRLKNVVHEVFLVFMEHHSTTRLMSIQSCFVGYPKFLISHAKLRLKH